MYRESRIREIIKTAAVAVLLVMLVCLCILWMLSYQGGMSAEFTKDTMNRLSGETVKYKYLEYLDNPCTMPSFIGFSAGRGMDRIGFSSGKEMESAYEDVLRFYEELFASESTVTPLSEEEGSDLFSKIMDGRCIYISYYCDMPKSVIIGTANPEMMFSDISGEYIREIFIVPDRYIQDGLTVGSGGIQTYASIYSFYAVARDSLGNYYRYTPESAPKVSEDISFNTNFYFSYNTEESALRYKFAATLETDSFLENHDFTDKITDTTIIYEDNSEARLLSVSPVTSGIRLEEAVLKAFYMNPEQVSSYTDESGIKTYFDEGRSVRFTPDGKVQYTAPGASGFSFEDVFGYHSAAEYDIYDYIGAALVVADALEPVSGNLGEDITLFLSNIEYDGSTLRLGFGYRCGGIPIFINGTADILVFELNDGSVQSVSFSMWKLAESGRPEKTPDFMWLLRGYLIEASDRRELMLAYLLSGDGTACGAELAALLR